MEYNFFTVSEQDAGKIKVPFASDVDIEKITEGDKNPMFVTIEALNDKEPTKNGRYYDKQTLLSIAEQVNLNKPDAYQGHLKEDERPYKNPESQAIWLGATVLNVDGANRLFIKGYVPKYAKTRRDYLKVAKSAGKQVFVSIYGQAREVWDKAKKMNIVRDIVLESIDWARSGGAGINGSLGYLSIASEQTGNANTKTILEQWELQRDSIVSEFQKDINKDIKKPKVNSQIHQLNKELADSYLELKTSFLRPKARAFVKTAVLAEMSNKDYTKENMVVVLEQVLSDSTNKDIIKTLSSNNYSDINPLNINSRDTRNYTKVVKR